MARVAMVCMPFYKAEVPPISLGLLKQLQMSTLACHGRLSVARWPHHARPAACPAGDVEYGGVLYTESEDDD